MKIRTIFNLQRNIKISGFSPYFQELSETSSDHKKWIADSDSTSKIT